MRLSLGKVLFAMLLGPCSAAISQPSPVLSFGGVSLPAGRLAVAHHPGVGQFGADIGFFRRTGVLSVDLFVDGSLVPASALSAIQFSLPQAAAYNPDLDEVCVAFDSGDLFAIDSSLVIRSLPSIPNGILAAGAMTFVPIGPHRGLWAHITNSLYAYTGGVWQQVVSNAASSGRLHYYPPTMELILQDSVGGLAQHLDPSTGVFRQLSGVITPPFVPLPQYEVLWSFQGSRHAIIPGLLNPNRTLIKRESSTLFVVSGNRESVVAGGGVARIWSENFASNPVFVRPGPHGRMEAFGSGCGPASGGLSPRLLERITNNDGPNPGRDLFVFFDQLYPSSAFFVVVGFSPSNVPIGLGAPGCSLLTSGELALLLGVASPSGGPAVALFDRIPATAALGIKLYAQGGQLVSGANSLDLVLTNGLEMTVGNRW